MNPTIPTNENYFYTLLKKKYHTSDMVRNQIAEMRENIREKVVKEPLKSFTIKLRGQVIDNSFEKTFKLISKHFFNKGRVNKLQTFKEDGYVEAEISATLTETETLIRYLMRRHAVLHCKKGVKGASNLLIIDEKEKSELGNFTPDYIHTNYVTDAESHEKFTGKIDSYFIVNGLPLTTENLGSEFRFNKIETKNKVFSGVVLKEICANLHFISLILRLDLEQHYLKMRIFNAQEIDLKSVEEKIDDLGFFADIFNLITTEDNPLLFNKDLFFDLMSIERVIENNDVKSLPAYDGYIYAAAKRVDGLFKLLEEYGLFLTYANCIEKFIAKIAKKLFKHKSDFRSEHHNLVANYNELMKLQSISNHPLLQNDYQDLLSSCSKLLAYIDFVSIRNVEEGSDTGTHTSVPIAGKISNGLIARMKNYVQSVFSATVTASGKEKFRHNQNLTAEQENDFQNLMDIFNEKVKSLSSLKTRSGRDAFLEARKCVPQLTNLSDVLEQLKKLTKNIVNKAVVHEPFDSIFAKTNKFNILYKELKSLVNLEPGGEQELAQRILEELQNLLHVKPLKENAYQKIVQKINALEEIVLRKNKTSLEKVSTIHDFMEKLNQNVILKTIIDIKAGLQNIIEKETQIQKIDTFKEEEEFFSYSNKELNEFLEEIITSHRKFKSTSCCFENILDYEATEKELDRLIGEVKDTEARILSNKRSKEKTITRETNAHIDYLKGSLLLRKKLESAILLIQNQISQMESFIHSIENYLHQHSVVYSGVSTSVLFDQITYLLSNLDVRLLDMTGLTEEMFNESVGKILYYQAGETFAEPKRGDMDALMKEIEKRTITRTYQNTEN
ncbi:MAG: hypothetical protein MRJ65_04750 [Candidatus Brocadiaceae bacterium]|nr:hypothetical protein [Candidatus Brocadiaceae bacterium]